MEMNFCRRCGTPLSYKQAHIFICRNGHTLFANSTPCVGIFLVTPDNQILVSVRAIEPHKGMLDAFGGFLDGEETVEHALEREMREELGLEPSDYGKPEFLLSSVGHYPFGGEVTPVLSSIFWARITTDTHITPRDDVAAIEQFTPHDLPLDQMHDDDVRVGAAKLKELLLSQS